MVQPFFFDCIQHHGNWKSDSTEQSNVLEIFKAKTVEGT